MSHSRISLDRRACGAGFVGAFLSAAVPIKSIAAAAPTTLCAAARAGGRYFGSAVREEDLPQDGKFAAQLLNQCCNLAPELALKWDRLQRQEARFDFNEMDTLADFARAAKKPLRGHTLLWHEGVPGWVVQRLASVPDWRVVARYFASVIPRYGDVITDWDVVNEPLDAQQADGMRRNTFFTAFGAAYVRRALEEARRFAPRGRLVINEFGLEYDGPDARKRELFLAMLTQLKHSGAPLDGVGIQAHLDLGKSGFDARTYGAFLRRIADLGLFITITELDVKEHNYVLPAAQRDRLVAEAASQYLDVALREPAVDGVYTWGLSDLYSWLLVEPADYARYSDAWQEGEGPGLNRGLPFDAAWNPKPMLESILAAFLRAPPRPAFIKKAG